MYPNQNANGQAQPDPSQQQQQQQWSPHPPPPNGQQQQYHPQPPHPQQQQQPQRLPPLHQQPQQQQQPPPPSQAQPGMPPPIQPNTHEYRLPALQQPPMYAGGYQQMPYPPAQPAPRQRTAIACRYCRRRKIRCSGFDQSEDGRCTNCQRFSQECVFTPVSAQTQAFVPAHTVWRGQGGPPPNTQLYGAYGQPLPHNANRDQYAQQPPPPQQGQYPPPPQGYQQQPMYGTPGQEAGRKRGTDEPHTPTLPPPNPAGQMQYPDAGKEDGSMENKRERNGVKDVGVQVNIL